MSFFSCGVEYFIIVDDMNIFSMDKKKLGFPATSKYMHTRKNMSLAKVSNKNMIWRSVILSLKELFHKFANFIVNLLLRCNK